MHASRLGSMCWWSLQRTQPHRTTACVLLPRSSCPEHHLLNRQFHLGGQITEEERQSERTRPPPPRRLEWTAYPLLVQRLRWKRGLIDSLTRQLCADPADLLFMSNLSDLRPLEYRKVRITGEFDHSRELIIQPRSKLDPDYRPGAGSAYGLLSGGSQSVIGAHVVTPFRLAGNNVEILVNRGWVSKDHVPAESRQEGQVSGVVSMTGIVRVSEKKPSFVSTNRPEEGAWFYRDVEEMAEHLGTAAVYIEADESSTVAGGPLGGQTRATLYNDHVSYICTWWTLCAITSFMWYRRYWRGVRML